VRVDLHQRAVDSFNWPEWRQKRSALQVRLPSSAGKAICVTECGLALSCHDGGGSEICLRESRKRFFYFCFFPDFLFLYIGIEK